MFRFKQFVIEQNHCAMKVSTDGILFGSWCNPTGAQRVLDIGTGTGLLSLMLAQKADNDTQITAIEIDDAAANQAQHNVKNSPWPEKIQVLHSSFQAFCKEQIQEPDGQLFDLIISNPPWFEYSPMAAHNQRHQNRDYSRTLARQQVGLTLSVLLQHAQQLLTEKGQLYLLLPASAETELLCLIENTEFTLLECCDVFASPAHQAHCQMWRFVKASPPVTSPNTKVVIRDPQHSYTQEFKKLCRDYYLNF